MEKFQISLAAARVNAGLTQDDVAKALKDFEVNALQIQEPLLA